MQPKQIMSEKLKSERHNGVTDHMSTNPPENAAEVASHALAGLVAGIRAAVEAPKGIPIRAALGDVRSSDLFGIFRAAKEKADDLLPPAEIVDAAAQGVANKEDDNGG